MFPRNRVTGVRNGRLRTEVQQQVAASASQPRRYQEQAATQVEASLGGMAGTSGAASMSVNSYWSSQYQYMFTGLIPAEPYNTDSRGLLDFYRDIYMNDATAGSAVDIQSSFPFSDFDLRGLDEKDLTIYREALDQLDILRLLPIVSTAYLTDGYFCGSLVFEPKQKRFLDTLVHDARNCQVMNSSFFNHMPSITVQTGADTQQMLNSNSPYTKQYVQNLPPQFVQMLQSGSFELNPVTTLFVARRTLTDRAFVSFLHRILPMYLIEKTMYRGTLVEASRRQRATTHLTAGDDIWTPTGEELNALVQQFQAAEFDPLGGWVSTRNAVQVTDIRPGGDFWKWTDMADTLVPYKMRAMGISEAFLSGDASYASAESAYSTFLETQNTYRQHLTTSIFGSRLFPLIAVANRMYKKGTPPERMVQRGDISTYLSHQNNLSQLRIPQLVWHKSLEAKGEENTFEMLEQASEKGVPIPLKAWMAAAGMDREGLLKDLADDKELRKTLQQYTGKDTAHESEDMVGDGDPREHQDQDPRQRRHTTHSANKQHGLRRPLLSREWNEPDMFTFSKTGKKQHVVHNPRGKTTQSNANIAKISARAAVDPEYRNQLAKANAARLGSTTLRGDQSHYDAIRSQKRSR